MTVASGWAALPAVLVLAGSAALADEKQGLRLAEAISGGEAGIALRYRFEHVDQAGFADNANASTLRLRLNFRTGSWSDWTAFGEFDYVGHLVVDDFNSGGGTSPGRVQYPVVADPDGADLNQLYVDYNGLAGWRWRFGRQRILLDDQRFVGGVGWRQNEQTFDAVSAFFDGLANIEVNYAYVANVNRIFGDSVPAGDHRMNTHLLNARIKLSDKISATPYAYYLDNDDDPAASTATLGIRLAGNLLLERSALSYLAEIARQSDTGNAPTAFNASFLHLDAHWTLKGGLSVGAGFELLGGNQASIGQAFRTPLATLHAFQGWADQFLVTPDAGIVDIYGKLGYRFGDWQAQVIYHDYSAESGDANFGREIDLSIERKISEHYGLLLKSALFHAESAPYADTNKYWLMLTADY